MKKLLLIILLAALGFSNLIADAALQPAASTAPLGVTHHPRHHRHHRWLHWRLRLHRRHHHRHHHHHRAHHRRHKKKAGQGNTIVPSSPTNRVVNP